MREEFWPRVELTQEKSAGARCSHVLALLRSAGGGGSASGKSRGGRGRDGSDEVGAWAHPDAELLLHVMRELRGVLLR